MNIIILTGRFGMGHIKAAEAIKEEIMAHGNNYAKIIDCMDYLFPTVSGGIYKGFDFMVSRCSGIYNALNKLSSKSSSVPLTASVIKKIDRLLDEYQADAVVVTFPVCSQYISAYKRMKQSDIPLYTYVTDVSVHEEWIAPGTDKYFVGDKTTKQTLVSKGVEEEKIVISGIPVRKCFYEKTLQNRSSQKKEILIMGGGLGLLPSSGNLLKKLNRRRDIHVTIIAGKNEKLRRDIERKYDNITAIGYTESVNEYMRNADLIVTKAGGITTFEAIAVKTPMYIIKPFLEQEFGNAKYIEEHNIGRVLWDKSADETADIIHLIEDHNLLEKMKNNMVEITEHFEKTQIYA